MQDTVNFAGGLQKLGVKPGDVLAILSENRSEYFTVVFGAICCGATVTTLNYQYTKGCLSTFRFNFMCIYKIAVCMCL